MMSKQPAPRPTLTSDKTYGAWNAISGDADETKLSLLDHFNELRVRLMRSIMVLMVGVMGAAAFTDRLLKYLIKPYGDQLQVLGPTENVVIYFRVALLAGAIFAMPYVTLQLFMFIAPGLTRKEKRWIYLALPSTSGLFLVGVAFAWFVMVPTALDFLSDFEKDVFEPGWTAERYIAFLTSLLFWIGVAFEMPVVVFVLARLGLLGPRPLIHHWRVAVVLMTIIAALITPTVDPFNMLLVMAPLMVLYIISIGLAVIAFPRRLR
ncbi:MAG: twin-arginine translocase subunit TatC, partial [Chloroflexi bacterium]|nr:twin-arginine translocase subunit TatC [Chloroflexota bacterium]